MKGNRKNKSVRIYGDIWDNIGGLYFSQHPEKTGVTVGVSFKELMNKKIMEYIRPDTKKYK